MKHLKALALLFPVLMLVYALAHAQGIQGLKNAGICEGSFAQVLTVPLLTTTTQQIITAGSQQHVYICGYGWSNAAAGSAKLVTGTGTFCGTKQTALTGAIIGNQAINRSDGPPLFLPGPMGANICLVAGGTSPTVQGFVSFVYGAGSQITATATSTPTVAPTNTPAPTATP